MSLVPYQPVQWWWPLFPYWTPNRTIRSNVLFWTDPWTPAWKECNIRGQWGDREWVTYTYPSQAAIEAAEKLFPSKGASPPWGEIAYELLEVIPWETIETLKCWEALERVTQYRMTKARQRQEIINTFIEILNKLQNVCPKNPASPNAIPVQTPAAESSKPELPPALCNEKVNTLLRQLFQELAPAVYRISELTDRIDRNHRDWLARDAVTVLNPLQIELNKAQRYLREWYKDDPLIAEFRKRLTEDVAVRSIFIKLDFVWQLLVGATDKIDRYIGGNRNLRDINFPAEIAQPLQELLAAARRYGFLPADNIPEFPAFRQDDDIGKESDRPAEAGAPGLVESAASAPAESVEAASPDTAQPAAPAAASAAEATLPESVSAEPAPAAPDRPAEVATPPVQPEPSAPTGQEVGQPATSPPQKPKKWLYGWQSIIDVIGRDILGPELNHDQRVSRLRYLNKQYGGPIRPGKRGQQPFVEEIELLEWWNSLSERYENSQQRLRDAEATVSVQYPFGDRGTVCPDINGGIKQRA